MLRLTPAQQVIFDKEYDKCLERERYASDIIQGMGDIDTSRKNELVNRELRGCTIAWGRLEGIVSDFKNLGTGFNPLFDIKGTIQ